ncbi:hypothetical protein GH733_013754 [Mirounga leonina]|nr:hypothetical protein GH733_013754 [Mirounga leonina]
MGVYLYGELMLSEDPRQQQVARQCFELTKEQMERSSAEVVAEMEDLSKILSHASTPSPGGTRIALTLDIAGRVMGLLKPSASSIHALVLLFPEAALPGAHGPHGAFVPCPELATSRSVCVGSLP